MKTESYIKGRLAGLEKRLEILIVWLNEAKEEKDQLLYQLQIDQTMIKIKELKWVLCS